MIPPAILLPRLTPPTESAITTVLSAWLILVALIILMLKPRDVLARRLALLVIVAALAAQVRGLVPVGGMPAYLVYIGALGLIPPTFLGFCSRLIQTFGPDEEPAAELRATLFRWASRVALITAALDIGCLTFVPPLAVATRVLLLGTQIVAYAIGYGFIVRHCLRARGSRSYQALLVITVGTVLAYTPALAFKDLLGIFESQPIQPYIAITAFQFALPIAYAFASIRWRAGSIVALVDRISVYVILALALVLAYVTVALLFERSVDTGATLMPQIVSLGFAAVVAVTYTPLRARLQRFLDKRLFRDHYNYEQTLQRFSSDLATLHTQDEVISLLLDGITRTLNTEGIAFIALPEGLDHRILTLLEDGDLRAQGKFDTPTARADVLRELAALGADSPLRQETPLLVDPWPGCLALVLISAPISTEGIGLLVLGNKRTSAGLRKTDRTLLITLAHQAGTALANAALVDGLRTSLRQVQISTHQLATARAEQQLLLRELVNANERQRAALAQDLHDDALQELLYLVRHARLAQQITDGLRRASTEGAIHLSDLGEGERVESDSAQSQRAEALFARLRLELGYLVERSAVAEHALRALCLGLYPALLPSLGLAAALDDLALDLSAATEVAVRVSYDEATAEAARALTPDAALHTYRIVQEAIRNAAKHAQSAEMEVTLTREPRREATGRPSGNGRQLCVVVQDHGPGLPMPLDFGDLLRHGHLGLAGMRERAGRAGGEIDFGAGPDGGTRITLRVPLAADMPPRSAVEASSEAATEASTRGVTP